MVLRAQLLLLLRLLFMVCITAPVLSQHHDLYGYGHIPYDAPHSPSYSHSGGGGGAASYGVPGGHENFVTPSSAIIYGDHGVGHGGPVYVEGGSTYGGSSYGGGGGGGGGVWKDDGPSYGGGGYGGGGGWKGDGPYVGRVRIQVYRGPTQKAGYNKYWAPWGYFVTQPRDQPGGKGYGGGYGGYH